ncbi:unnamed protein product [Sympodiomycopsis kandeliae]
MKWAQFTATLVTIFTICSLIEQPQQVASLPTLRTYRGVSPYRALAEGGLDPADDENPPAILDPRQRHPKENWDPRLMPGAIRHPYGGKYNQRPQWADRIVKKSHSSLHSFLKFAARMGFDFLKLADITNPAGQIEAALDISKGHEIYESFSFEDGNTVILGNGTVLSKEHFGLGTKANVVDSGFDYENTPVRGVNIGNWLLMECWMDPGYCSALNKHAVNAPYPNAIVDEWTSGQYSDYDYQEQVFKGHYESWFGEDDMRQIAAAGLNHVRIPVPFWAFGETNRNNEPYRTWNQYDKLIQAVGWARKYGVKVWIDLHGVPGSQNGFDNSGHTGGIGWTNDPDNIKRTKYVFDRLVKTFNGHEWYRTVTAFEAINEPQGHNQKVLNELVNDYYPWALGNIKDNTKKRLLAFHDAFVTPGYWADYFNDNDKTRTILDTHPYFVYSDYEKNANDRQRVREVCQMRDSLSQSKDRYITVAGEISTSSPKGDNGQGRNLPKGKINIPGGGKYSDDYHYFLAFNFRVQQHVFETSGNGWIYWAWFNKQYADWSFKTGIKHGWLPKSEDEFNNNPLGKNPCNLVGL